MNATVRRARRYAGILLVACVIFMILGGLAQSMRITRMSTGYGISAANAAPNALFPGQKAAILGATHLLNTQTEFLLFVPIIQN
jgi:hypothetical protein